MAELRGTVCRPRGSPLEPGVDSRVLLEPAVGVLGAEELVTAGGEGLGKRD